ncbi:stage II sporulation protein D [Paenibacillus sp. LHD-117]|uniref:stage II sporulation protein D n=1 Tax=Paenibacillus sp. LHD-117 TaxID=3071412 RepID=UPI0027E10117|nr:stage II sporulation protein D [Paenibacillus sp. LHD-117]MDQ6420933.1 stage II sporulation protein D [Paenibacillus sp. LHD-117]
MRWFLAEADASGAKDGRATVEARDGPAAADRRADIPIPEIPNDGISGKDGQAAFEPDHRLESPATSSSKSDKADKPGTGNSTAGSAGKDSLADQPKQPVPQAASGAVKSPKPVQAAASGKSALEGVRVRVYLNDTGKVETVPIETYVIGVLAGEMPIDFELEALKAQAVAARTYIVRRLAAADNDMARKGADVSDTIQHQVYVSKSELARRWSGEAKSANLAKLKRAVQETEGLVITYEGEPIEAAFFSTSNGYTENSEEYWTLTLPYLRSVASPWDKELSPRYEQEETMKLSQFYRLMGITGKAAGSKPALKVIERTEGKRIKEMKINGKLFTGREVRERLGLASSQFSWKIGRGTITFTTYGLGHGVGMSQWGANGMAKGGGKAADILLHYYTGTRVEQASKLPSG